jgi:hypothetical protein
MKPTSSINIKGFILNLNFEPQKSKNGRMIRLSGISKNIEVPEKWINKICKYHWFYHFRYLDGNTEIVSFEFDYNDNFLKQIK